jgi:hypothetical protein
MMSETLKETQVEKEKNIITVDEVEYNIDDLSDELKMIINHVMDLERKISNSILISFFSVNERLSKS